MVDSLTETAACIFYFVSFINFQRIGVGIVVNLGSQRSFQLRWPLERYRGFGWYALSHATSVKWYLKVNLYRLHLIYVFSSNIIFFITRLERWKHLIQINISLSYNLIKCTSNMRCVLPLEVLLEFLLEQILGKCPYDMTLFVICLHNLLVML